MWDQWLLKSKNGNTDSNDVHRGPAPPAAVAAASKIAFSALGSNAPNLLRTEDHKKSVVEGSPVDSAVSSFMERSESGTLLVPQSTFSVGPEISDFLGGVKTQGMNNDIAAPLAPSTSVKSLLDDHERRTQNLRWLRLHFRFLNDVGRLPFHNADLWQLHQYFFSPPFYISDSVASESSELTSLVNEVSSIPILSGDQAVMVPEATYYPGTVDGISSHHGIKRSSSFVEEMEGDTGHTSKKAKSLKPRIEYYPRVMVSETFSSFGLLCVCKF